MQVLKVFLEILMATCFGVSLLASFFLVRDYFFGSKASDIPLSQLPVRKTKFVQLALDWCHEHLAYANTQKPSIKVNYYPHKQWGGMYRTWGHECVIYIHSHETALQVINAVIHEYTHARQRNKNFDKQYDKFNQEVGYWDNPFEIEARKVAERHQLDCLEWVQSMIPNWPA
jgi:hypothetical protein